MRLKLFAFLGIMVSMNSGYSSEDFWNSNSDSTKAFTNNYIVPNVYEWNQSVFLKITEINQSWAGLKDLTVPVDKWLDVDTVYLGNNNFTHIPSDLSRLVHLKELYLENNKIKNLSSENLKQLRFAKKVMLHNNYINCIDPSISELGNLEELSLANNHLTTLPSSIIWLKDTIKILNLLGNPLEENGIKQDGKYISLGWKQLQKIFGGKLLFTPFEKACITEGDKNLL